MNNGGPALTAWLDVGERHFPLVGKNFSFGRSKDNDVVFGSPKVSRRHAIVHAQGASEFLLVDLGSSNGTHLNGRRITQPTNLQHGDVIQIGEQNLVFRLETAEVSADQVYVTEGQTTVQDVKDFSGWFLLADIENFVQLSREAPSADLARMVWGWLGECQRVVEKNGGTVSKFLGDGLLVYWNARDCDPARVVAALDILCWMQTRREPPFRWGLHYGTAVFEVATTEQSSVQGQDVNFLFRMGRLAATKGFSNLISPSAQMELSSLRQGESVGEFPLKGFDGEYSFFRWQGSLGR